MADAAESPGREFNDERSRFGSRRAFLRDPLEIGGSDARRSPGLEPTNRPLPPPPDRLARTCSRCVPGPGPDPESGVLQFDAATYTIDEFAAPCQPVTVTRTGGSAAR